MSTKTKTQTKPSKKTQKLDKMNLKKAAPTKPAIETIYIYPAEAVTPQERKAFRRKARQTRSRLEKQIAKAKGDDLKKAKAALQEFKETTLA